MKKVIILLATICFLFYGCTPKDDPEIVVDPLEETQNNTPAKGDMLSIAYKDVDVKEDCFVLELDIEFSPAQEEVMLHLMQDGFPVDFALRENGEYSQIHPYRFKAGKHKERFYFHPNDVKKGDVSSVGLAIIKNAEMPKGNDLLFSDKEFQIKQEYHGKRTSVNYWDKVKQDAVMEELDIIQRENVPYAFITDDKDFLYELAQAKKFNDDEKITITKDEQVKLYVFLNFEAEPKIEVKRKISFYIDHTPVKIEDKYYSAMFGANEKIYAIASFDLQLPETIEKGEHTLYAQIYDWYSNGEDSYTSYVDGMNTQTLIVK